MKEGTVSQIAIATQLWLDFQIMCGRQELLSEAYLAQPVGEFLGNLTGHRIKTEWEHPAFKNKGRGRPRQIDYVLSGKDKDYLKTAIEVKWIRDQPVDSQLIVNDIMRLECVRNENGQGMDRYFLLAGEKAHVGKFLRKKVNAGGASCKFIEGFLPVDQEDSTGGVEGIASKVSVQDCEKPYRKFFTAFHDSYGVRLPKSYKSILVNDQQGRHVRVLLWKVNSIPGKRVTFSPPDCW